VRSLSFASPVFLLALLVVPVVVCYAIWADRRRSRYPVAFTNLDVLAGVVSTQRAWRRWIPLALLALALATTAAAVARPRVRVSVPDEHATVVLLIDTSGSMRAKDVEPTRLDAARGAIVTFLDKLPKSVRVGLVEFSSAPTVLSAPTRDREETRTQLDYIAPDRGTAIGDGIASATRLVTSTLRREGVHRNAAGHLPAAIVLLSDGAQNRGDLAPLDGARRARRAGIRVHTVALGTAHGVVRFGFGPFGDTISVPPDPVTLRAIARSTGGRSYKARDADRLEQIYSALGSDLGRTSKRRNAASWFSGAAAVLLLGSLGLGRAWGERLP
jgi:Ca-activated chloride channel family protein